jgi:hypothetical protein
VSKVRRGFFGLPGLLVLLTACGGAPSQPTYTTPQRALEGRLDRSVKVYQEVPSGDDRLLLYQGEHEVAPAVALADYVGWERWQIETGLGSGPLRNIGFTASSMTHASPGWR